jgi:hypothetical protein
MSTKLDSNKFIVRAACLLHLLDTEDPEQSREESWIVQNPEVAMVLADTMQKGISWKEENKDEAWLGQTANPNIRFRIQVLPLVLVRMQEQQQNHFGFRLD